MKKISLFVVVVGVVLMLFSNAYAAPSSVTIDSQDYSGDDYTFGFDLFFEQGVYEFTVGSGAWNDRYYFDGSWIWSANIYQMSTGLDEELGDVNNQYDTRSDALSFNQNDSLSIMVSNPSGENLRFYIKSDSEFNNRSSVVMNVAVVPEPLSSILFIVGGLAFAGRRYIKKNRV